MAFLIVLDTQDWIESYEIKALQYALMAEK
jgi:hypothetical protein